MGWFSQTTGRQRVPLDGRQDKPRLIWIVRRRKNCSNRGNLPSHLLRLRTAASARYLVESKMPAFLDLTNRVFSRWTVREFAHRDQHKTAYWFCECSCPARTRKAVRGSRLVSGLSTSCGCFKLELAARFGTANHNFKHGHRGHPFSPTYCSCMNMGTRCTNPKYEHWFCYGGAPAPVQICDGLRKFAGFLSVLGERPKRRVSTSLRPVVMEFSEHFHLR